MSQRNFLFRSIRIKIFVGILLVTPVAATIVVFNFLFRLATGWMPEILIPILETVQPPTLQRIVILLLTLLLLYLTGLLASNLIGRRLYRIGDWILARIPVVKNIYMPASRILEALFSQRKTLFKEVVMLEYPRRGIFSIAFVTAQLPAFMSRKATGKEPQEQWVSLFVPTTPNPTSGVLIFAPRSEIHPLNMPIPDALTFLMSAGAVIQKDGGDRITLLDRIDEWLRTENHAEGEAQNEH